jgi:hypothetical protein
MGHTGSGYYVEACHPDFALPLRKTYEWYQRDIAAREFEVLCAVVGAAATASRKPNRKAATKAVGAVEVLAS